MEAAEKNCESLNRKLERAKRRFGASDMDVEILHGDRYETMIKEVHDISDDLVNSIEELTINFKADLGDNKVKQWEDKIDEIEHHTKIYTKQIRMKAAYLRSSSLPVASVQQPTVHQSTVTDRGEEVRKAQVKVQNAVVNIREDVLSLGNEVNRILDWGLALDHEVA